MSNESNCFLLTRHGHACLYDVFIPTKIGIEDRVIKENGHISN